MICKDFAGMDDSRPPAFLYIVSFLFGLVEFLVRYSPGVSGAEYVHPIYIDRKFTNLSINGICEVGGRGVAEMRQELGGDSAHLIVIAGGGVKGGSFTYDLPPHHRRHPRRISSLTLPG